MPLDPATTAVLREPRRGQLAERLMIGPAYQDRDLVFATIEGTEILPAGFAKAFKRHVAADGLPRIPLHGLRHTYASVALKSGVHPKVVQERLGHSSVGSTLDIYSHLVPSMQEEAAGLVADVILGANGSQKVAGGGSVTGD